MSWTSLEVRQLLYSNRDNKLGGCTDQVDPSGSRVPPPPFSSSLEDRRRGGVGSDVQPAASCHHILPEVELLCPSPDGSFSHCVLLGLWPMGCQLLPHERPVKWPKKYLSHPRDAAEGSQGRGLRSGAARGSRGPLAALSARPHTVSMDLSVCSQNTKISNNALLASPSNICVLRNLLSSPPPPPKLSWPQSSCHAGRL